MHPLPWLSFWETFSQPLTKVIHEARTCLLQVYEMWLETTIVYNQGQYLLWWVLLPGMRRTTSELCEDKKGQRKKHHGADYLWCWLSCKWLVLQLLTNRCTLTSEWCPPIPPHSCRSKLGLLNFMACSWWSHTMIMAPLVSLGNWNSDCHGSNTGG